MFLIIWKTGNAVLHYMASVGTVICYVASAVGTCQHLPYFPHIKLHFSWGQDRSVRVCAI